jgi:hypothetical protein
VPSEDPANSEVQSEVGVVITYIRTTVRLPSLIHEQIESVAQARSATAQAIVRLAIEQFLRQVERDSASPSSADLTRIALTTEFTQASIEVLLREYAPEYRDHILLTVEQRMGTYHGQK